MTDERLHSIAVVAKRAKLSEQTIRRCIRRGTLKALRTPGGERRGGNFLVPESAVRDFLQHLQHPSAPNPNR